jgi:hypothetical protein
LALWIYFTSEYEERFMFQTPSHALLWLAVLLSFGSTIAIAEEPAVKPDLHDLRRIGAKTQSDLNDGKAASWTMVHEIGPGVEAIVDVYATKDMQHYTVSASNGVQREKWFDLIVRDGFWHVVHGKKAMKCRAYEAPTDIPIIYPVLSARRRRLSTSTP